MKLQSAKRRIQVASFSFGDVARGHVLALVLGAALILGAGAAGWAAGSNAQANADAKGAARILIAASGQVINGSADLALGDVGKLAQSMLRGALGDLRASAGSPVCDPGLKAVSNATLLAASGLLGSLAEVNAAATVPQAGAIKGVSKDQLTRVLNAATAAKSAGEQLGTFASRSDTVWTLGAAAAAMLVAGLAALGFTLTRVLDDFGRRYHRGVQQFRAEETALQALAQDLRRAAESRNGDFAVSEANGELAEICQLINKIAEQHAGDLNAMQLSAQGALKEESAATALVDDAEAQSRSLVDTLREAGTRLAQLANFARLVSLDAQAASHAADEASARSADANQIAQDASSRMEALREGLQETAKGIKRLGERTQEIDTVVDSMELLSEQIGVLALNASLEAERAGESGAGFRVVAKEVQSLAHRSEEALKKISALVQGAQADARAAASLLDRSTHHVVSGSNVGAVSHALLVALPPLAASIEVMARSISDSSREGASQLGQAQALLLGAAAAADVSADKTSQLRSPLERVRKQLKLAFAGA
jgi:methyl-accepting chemotaxis protein